MDFDVWGGPWPLARRGYRITGFEGRPLVDVGGWGYSGVNGDVTECPIGKIVDDLSGSPHSGK